MKANREKKLLYYITEDWYFVSHRLPLAISAKNAGYDVCIVTRVRNYGNIIRSSGLKLIPFENSRSSINPLRELLTLFRLIALFMREKPDIVHNVAIKPVLYGGIAARLVKTPQVVNALAGMGWIFASSTGLARWIKPAARQMLRFVLTSGTVLVQNQDDAAFLTQIGVPRANIRRIAGAGVDLTLFHASPEKTGLITVVLPARLLWDKGVGEFVEAARIIRKQGINAHFALAGESDHANPASISPKTIAEWVLEGVVDHLGWVENMPSLFAQSHIVCLPSYYGEGIPKSLIEAAASGRPIVTTDMPGCREIVRHNENGFLVPPRNAKALAKALVRLIEDPVLRQQMGAQSRIRAEKEYGVETVNRQTLALYEEALS